MAVGASQPTLVGTKDGRIGLKTQMQASVYSTFIHYDKHALVHVFIDLIQTFLPYF